MQKLFNRIYNINFYIILFLPLIFILRSFTLNFFVSFVAVSYIANCFIKNSWNFFKEKSVLFIFLLFIYIIVNGIFFSLLEIPDKRINYLLNLFGLIRFPIFSIAVCCIITKINRNQLKKIKLSYLITFLIVCLDIGIQYLLGKSILGFPPGMCFELSCERFSGPFGEELIAGTYLYIIGSLLIILFLKKEIIFSIFIILITLFFILLTGDRSPFLGFLLFILTGIIILKIKKKIKILIGILIFFITLFTIINFNHLKERYFNFINYSFFSFKNLEIKKNTEHQANFINRTEENPWIKHYNLAYKIFKDNPFFGSGYKTFRVICKEYVDPNFEKSQYKSCSSHPHNFFLEILSEQGLVGLSLFLIFLALIVYNFKFCINKKNTLISKKFIMITIFFLSIYFPFKPSGSFYTTWNSSLIFFIYGFYLYYLNSIKRR
jgi:O-antigen ligase